MIACLEQCTSTHLFHSSIIQLKNMPYQAPVCIFRNLIVSKLNSYDPRNSTAGDKTAFNETSKNHMIHD